LFKQSCKHENGIYRHISASNVSKISRGNSEVTWGVIFPLETCLEITLVTPIPPQRPYPTRRAGEVNGRPALVALVA